MLLHPFLYKRNPRVKFPDEFDHDLHPLEALQRLWNNLPEKFNQPFFNLASDELAQASALDQVFEENQERPDLVVFVVSQAILHSLPKVCSQLIFRNCVVKIRLG